MTAALKVVLAAAYGVLDDRLGILPGPGNGLPAQATEAVFIRALETGRSGLGRRSTGPLPAQDDIRHGLIQLEAEYLIWARDPAALAARSRLLIDALLDLPETSLPPAETSPGRVRNAEIVRGEPPLSEGNAWRQSVLVRVEVDYRVVTATTEGVIDTVEVDLVGEFDEDFSVGGGN